LSTIQWRPSRASTSKATIERSSDNQCSGAIGMAAIGVALWKYVMRYAPHTPIYFNRDRFVLSNGQFPKTNSPSKRLHLTATGHTCLFQYTFLHLTGFRDMTLDQLKSYHSERVDALCPGHPEIEHEGIEVTTGPLGQGVANAVGLAIATKNLQATYNKPGFDVVSNHTWCMIGDACLQEVSRPIPRACSASSDIVVGCCIGGHFFCRPSEAE
jgi:dihydroxyacetone synthase